MNMDYGTIFEGVQTDLIGVIGEVAPAALTVFAGLLGLGIAVKVFRRFAK